MTNVKLGKKIKKTDPRTLQFSRYMAKLPLPPPPGEVSWIMKVPKWPMHLNDELGDCTVAAAAHMIEQWSFYAQGSEILVPDPAVLQAYMDVSGYIPGHPETDNGAFMLDVLNYWRKTGIGGHRITAFVEVNPQSDEEIQWAIQLFGNVYTGIAMPRSAMGQNSWTVADGGIYTEDGKPWSWGGHCVGTMAGSPITRSVVSWGDRYKMSQNFWRDYVDEAYAVVGPEWINRSNGQSPSGFNMNMLLEDLAQFTKPNAPAAV